MDQKEIKISVIIPAYNTAEYMDECMQSVLSQTLQEIEIICVDDESTDDTLEILRRYESADERVHVIAKQHSMIGETRNTGIDAAVGKYIYFMDSDDYLKEDGALEKMYMLAEEKELDVLSFSSSQIFESEEVRHITRKGLLDLCSKSGHYDSVMTGPEMYVSMFLQGDNSVCLWLLLIRRQFLLDAEIRFQKEIHYEDNAFYIEIFVKAKRTYTVLDQLYVHRFRANSAMTAKKDWRYIYGYAVTCTEIERFLRTKEVKENKTYREIMLQQLHDRHYLLGLDLRVVSQEEVRTALRKSDLKQKLIILRASGRIWREDTKGRIQGQLRQLKRRMSVVKAAFTQMLADRKAGQILRKKPAQDGEVLFSADSGAYASRYIRLTMKTGKNSRIHYTLDCTRPAVSSAEYRKPVVLSHHDRVKPVFAAKDELINPPGHKDAHIHEFKEMKRAVILRAASVSPDKEAEEIYTRTYFPGMNLVASYHNVPVISIVTEPENLFDHDTGIMVLGKVYDEWKETPEGRDLIEKESRWWYQGNYSQRGEAWEREASLEIFDCSNAVSFRQTCGLRIQGQGSTMMPQRSLSLHFGKKYADNGLNYPIIPWAADMQGNTIRSYTELILSNGSNAAEFLKYKEPMLHGMLRRRHFSVSEMRTVIVFINGEYWGPYILTEPFCGKYLADHYGADPENVAMINEGAAEIGGETALNLYHELTAYAGKDLTDEKTWQEFKDIMDIRSMADYCAAEIYLANEDWEQEINTRLWRSIVPSHRTEFDDGRWRYMLYDIMYSSAMYQLEKTGPECDSIEKALKDFPLFRAAMQNEEFQELFRAAVQELMEDVFSQDNVRRQTEKYRNEWYPLMQEYWKRFEDREWAWDQMAEILNWFFEKRPEYIIRKKQEIRGTS